MVLIGRLRNAIEQLNPAIPAEARDDALRKVLRVGTPSLTQTNRAFHRMLRDGVAVEYSRPDGSIAGDHVRLVDFGNPLASDWLAVNQFTVIEGQHNRRPDIVAFVNGLPLGVIELKNAADEDATIWSAYAQLQTYNAEIASLLHDNAALVVSDGLQARIGSLTAPANQEWFKVWRTIDGEGDAPKTALELEVLVRGVFDQQRFLDLLQHFIVFRGRPGLRCGTQNHCRLPSIPCSECLGGGNGARQRHGRERRAPRGRRHLLGRPDAWRPTARSPSRGGMAHTGQWQSFSMLFYAARVVRHPVMKNPTLVVLTDRNDLDDQLFGQFQRCHDTLGQKNGDSGTPTH